MASTTVSCMTAAAADGYLIRPRDFRSMIFLEEEEEEDDGYGSWAKQAEEDEPFLDELLPTERDIIEGLDRRARRYSRRGGWYRKTHILLSVLSIVLAALVPVAIGLGAPGWVPMTAGAISAIGQGILQLAHVDQHAIEIHSMLVRLTAKRDQLKAAVRTAQTRGERSALVDGYERDAIAMFSDASIRLASLDRVDPVGRNLTTRDTAMNAE